LRACGKGMRIIGRHVIQLVAISGALTATLYSQQPATPIACSGVLGDTDCNLGLLLRDASRSVPHSRNGGFQYRSFTHFHYWDPSSKQGGLASGRLWPSRLVKKTAPTVVARICARIEPGIRPSRLRAMERFAASGSRGSIYGPRINKAHQCPSPRNPLPSRAHRNTFSW